MADLVSGRFPQANVWNGLFGANAVNPNYPARSNAEYLGLSNVTDGALAGTGIFCAVPVYVDPGTVITNVSFLVGGTAASLPTHSAVAIYSGTTSASAAALLGKSADGTSLTTFAGTASVVTTALSSPYQVKSTDVSNGYLYVGNTITATTIPTAMVVAYPTALQASASAFQTGSPQYFSLTSGSSLAGVPAATLASPSAKAVAPVYWLT